MSTYHVDVLRKVLCVKKGLSWKILFSQISGRGGTRREGRQKKGDGPYLKRKTGENGVVKLWRGRMEETFLLCSLKARALSF